MRTPLILAPALVLAAACQSTSEPTDTALEAEPLATTESDAPVPADPELAARLLELMEADQAARGALIDAMQDAQSDPGGTFQLGPEQLPLVVAMQAADATSTAFLRELVAERGWPTHDLVGEEAAHAAWLLVQHADAAPDLQQEVLDLMAPLVASGQASGKDLAYLTDRVRAGRGEPQLYGTQFAGDAAGIQRPQPIEDPANVDARRAAVGLPSLAEYAVQLREVYGGEVSLEPLAPQP